MRKQSRRASSADRQSVSLAVEQHAEPFETEGKLHEEEAIPSGATRNWTRMSAQGKVSIDPGIVSSPSLNDIPGKIEDSAVLSFLSKKEVTWNHIEDIKFLTGIDYVTLSNWLNIDVKTLRKWKNSDNKFKQEDQEKVLLLMILIKHGIDVFGSGQRFRQWLNSDNFYFDKKPPASFLTTGSGIRFIDNSLTGIEYGDNA